MKLRTGVSLPAQPRRSFARFGLVIRQHVVRIYNSDRTSLSTNTEPPTTPFRIVVQRSFVLQTDAQARQSLQRQVTVLNLSTVQHWLPQISGAVRVRAVRSVLQTMALDVALVRAQTGLVVSQMVALFRVVGVAMQKRTAEIPRCDSYGRTSRVRAYSSPFGQTPLCSS